MSMMDMSGPMMPPGGGMPGGGMPPDSPDQGDGATDPLELYKAMKELLREAIDVEHDQEDVLALEKISTLVQQLIANNQKLQDQAMSGAMDPKMMRKAYGSGGSGGY